VLITLVCYFCGWCCFHRSNRSDKSDSKDASKGVNFVYGPPQGYTLTKNDYGSASFDEFTVLNPAQNSFGFKKKYRKTEAQTYDDDYLY
jgi:hypothetical protein